MEAAVRRAEGVIDALGKVALWLTLAIVVLVAVNVLLRYTLSIGSVWAQELEWHLLAAVILLGMSYAQQRGEAVRVDLFYGGYGPRMKFVVDMLSHSLALCIALAFVRFSWGYVGQAWAVDEGSPDPGGIPHRWVVKGLIPFGFAMLALQTLAAAARRVLQERDRKQERVRA
jgi:TRAP-type mannitol/chloroaromatic compound transport system permease small subunit